MKRFQTHLSPFWMFFWIFIVAFKSISSAVLPVSSWCGVDSHLTPIPAKAGGQGGALPQNPYTEGEKRFILIRVDFDDLPGTPFSDDIGLTLLTNVNKYFTSASQGKTEFLLPDTNGAALTPTFRMPMSAAHYGTNNLFVQLRADARTAAAAAGYVLSDYDFDMVWMGNVPGFTWAGLGFIGVPGAWLRNNISAGIASHELGHNLGLNHANFWNTSDGSVVGDGSAVESGDNFDTMGSGGENRVFNTRYKRLLNWLSEEEVGDAVNSGSYRIYAHDMPGMEGLQQALSIPRLNGTNYWVEYRQAIPENPWVQNGVQLRWGFIGNQRTLLLDQTPGSPEGRNDGALLVGQTFSDRLHGIHLTVTATGGGELPWVDLTLNRGAFLANVPPTLTLLADATNVAVGNPVQFMAMALDDNGDDLFYHWDFGDQKFDASQPAVAHSWDVTGEYRVRCTVSDGKGGRHSSSLLVRVGMPSGSQISGRVVDENGIPVQDVRVGTALYFFALTDSDGRYTLSSLPDDLYLLAAGKQGFAVSPSNFTNRVLVSGTDLENIDFLAHRTGSEVDVVLVPVGSSWRYLDDGSDPGSDWMQPVFGDETWSSGHAQLGYGDGDEVTVIDFGLDPDNKPITAYFRHSFLHNNSEDMASLHLGVERDDGAVVYLNGNEVFRNNLPIGLMTPSIRALDSIGGTKEITFIEASLSPDLLQTGTNLIAVEIHQQDSDSSDLSFDLYVTGTSRTNLSPGIAISNPSPGSLLYGPTNLLLRVNAWGGPEDLVDHVDYFIGGNLIGSSSVVPFSLMWPEVGFGDYTLTATAMTVGGIQFTSGPVRFSVGTVLVSVGSTWRYFDQGDDLGDTWRGMAFDDVDWDEGDAQLGYGDNDEVTEVEFGLDENNKHITTYFRKWFDLPSIPYPEFLRLQLIRDDGAVVYINGQEVRRSNLPFLGLIHFNTLAQTTIGRSEESVFEVTMIPAAGLLQESNIVAVEIHQRSVTSPDISFELELVVPGPDITEHPPLGIEWMDGILELNWPTNVTGFVLEESLTPDPATPWTVVTAPPIISDGLYRVLLFPEGPIRFYQLRKP